MKRCLLLIICLPPICIAQSNEGSPYAGNNAVPTAGSPYLTCLVTQPFPVTTGDRCSTWLGLFESYSSYSKLATTGGTYYACIDARSDVQLANSTTGTIMCMSDPFPVVDDTLTTNQFTGGVSTGNWLDVGGNMYFPSAIMSVGSSLELANNQTHVYGSGDGGAVTGGSPTIFQAASGFIPYYTSGQTPCNTSTPPFSNSCFSPAVVAFGAKAGDMAVLNLGPYRQTIEGIDVDAQGNAHIGFSVYSGQEGSSVKRLSVTDAKGTGIDWCGFYGQCGDGLLLDEFTVTHTSNTCVNPSTPVSFTSWSATVVAGVGLVVVGTYSGVSTPPNPPPLPGYYATFAGLPCSGGTCPSGVDPNGVYRIAATYSGTTTPVTLWADGRIAQAVSGGSYFTGLSPQIAWVINGSTAGSAGMGGQATFTSVEAAFNGFSSREIKNATLDSGTSCTATPYADMEVSSNGLANPALQNIQNIHMEHATNGAVIGEDGVTSMILGDDWNCNHISGDCVLISNQFGGPTNVTLRNIASANGNNTLVDQPGAPFKPGFGLSWAVHKHNLASCLGV